MEKSDGRWDWRTGRGGFNIGDDANEELLLFANSEWIGIKFWCKAGKRFVLSILLFEAKVFVWEENPFKSKELPTLSEVFLNPELLVKESCNDCEKPKDEIEDGDMLLKKKSKNMFLKNNLLLSWEDFFNAFKTWFEFFDNVPHVDIRCCHKSSSFLEAPFKLELSIFEELPKFAWASSIIASIIQWESFSFAVDAIESRIWRTWAPSSRSSTSAFYKI